MSQEVAEPRAQPVQIPIPGPVPAVSVGRSSRTTLANGLSVLVVPRPSVPRVELRLTIPAGVGAAESPAAAELLRRGLALGTSEMDQHALSESLQLLGGSLQVGQDQDRLQIASASLSEAEEELYRLVAELVTAPYFPKPELETERATYIEELAVARATPYFPAVEELQQIIYGDHPYGRPEPTDGVIKRTGRSALLHFHARSFAPAGSQITVVGRVDPRRTIARLRRAFGEWSGPRRVPMIPRVHAGRSSGVLFVDRPGSVQTVVLMAASTPSLLDPDYLALSLASAVLGGSFSCRMFKNLREDKGYTYSPHSRLETHLRDGLFNASMEVRNEVTAPAYLELLYEIGRLSTTVVPEQELEDAKSYLSGTRVLMLQTQAGLASSLAQLQSHGLDQRYLQDYSRRLARLTAEDVKRACQQYLAPSRLTTVMAGDAAAVVDELETLAEVQVRRRSRQPR